MSIHSTLIDNPKSGVLASVNGVASLRTDCCCYAVTPVEMVQIALGRHFTLASGKEVNATYVTWVKNLTHLVECGHIDSKMMQGFMSLNQYHRSADESSSNNGSDSDCNTGCGGQVKPEEFYPPYVC